MKSTINLLFLLVFLCYVWMSCSQSKDYSASPGERFQSFTDDGAWCWFSDPRAIYFEGKHKRTYAGWVDSSGNILVGFYDHEKKYIETKILHENLEVDDHDNPSLFLDKEGKLMVLYSKHAKQDPIFLQKGKTPESISEWEPVKLLSVNDTLAYSGLSKTYTYTNICHLNEENKLYLFWRGVDFKPNVSVSSDNGNSWTPGKIFILPERIYKNRRPYLKVGTNNNDAIHFAFTDGHPRDEPTNSIYYAKYYRGAFRKANGEKIGDWEALPLQPHQCDIVYDATDSKEKAWIWDVAENKDGNPVIVYSRFPSDSSHVYYYSIWHDGKWNNYELVNSGPWFPETPEGKTEREPNYSGGIVLDHNHPNNVYLSRKKNGKFEIEKWKTYSNGKRWTITEITKNSQSDNVRPFVIRNYSIDDSLKVLWLNVDKYIHYTDYKTSVKMNLSK